MAAELSEASPAWLYLATGSPIIHGLQLHSNIYCLHSSPLPTKRDRETAHTQ